jgi:carbon monoxide dehydrogenase subunit G
MNPISVSTEIAAPPTIVWAKVTDLEGSVDAISGIEAVEVLTDGPFDLGTRWRETRTMFGKTATEVMTVSAIDNGHSYTTVADSHGAHYESTVSVEPTASGSRLTMTFTGTPTSTMGKVMAALTGWMAKGATIKALQKDLDDLKRVCEASA